ncbi:MAG: 1-pyrroline-5-carboxylate dehydrogenase, partial [Myxococcota bacterium]
MSTIASTPQTPTPTNEGVRAYAPGSAERDTLKAELARQSSEIVEIPCVIGGERIFTGKTVDITMPHNHGHVIGRLHLADEALTEKAIANNLAAQADWAALHWEERAAIFLRAADLLAGPWRDRLNASTMLGQSKTCHQAEVDAACELIDFWRFNATYVQQLCSDQPSSNPGMWNRLDYRPLEGFVFAVTPFNFTSIALNIPSAPAMVGNVVLWKPSITQAHSAWVGMQLMEEAGVPPGVINLIHGHGPEIGNPAIASPHLAGLHFTGSTPTFQRLWGQIGANIANYRTYPRIVGETGGKDFIIAHPSADVAALSVAIMRGSFEYQGQKCSAASRLYIPRSLWPEVRDRVVAGMAEMKMGDVSDFSNYISAVIDERAFNKHTEYLKLAHDTATVHAGGSSDGSVGWFVQPTLVEVDSPDHRMMSEEIFGPIVTAFVYEDD